MESRVSGIPTAVFEQLRDGGADCGFQATLRVRAINLRERPRLSSQNALLRHGCMR